MGTEVHFSFPRRHEPWKLNVALIPTAELLCSPESLCMKACCSNSLRKHYWDSYSWLIGRQKWNSHFGRCLGSFCKAEHSLTMGLSNNIPRY